MGAAFDRPVSTYSQGMLARLGFAVAECRRARSCSCWTRCTRRSTMSSVRSSRSARGASSPRGGIVVAAGHDHDLLRRLCERALWLDGGSVREDGPFDDVVAAYVG